MPGILLCVACRKVCVRESLRISVVIKPTYSVLVLKE